MIMTNAISLRAADLPSALIQLWHTLAACCLLLNELKVRFYTDTTCRTLTLDTGGTVTWHAAWATTFNFSNCKLCKYTHCLHCYTNYPIKGWLKYYPDTSQTAAIYYHYSCITGNKWTVIQLQYRPVFPLTWCKMTILLREGINPRQYTSTLGYCMC